MIPNVVLATAASTTPIPITQVLTSGGEVVTSMLGWVTDVANTVVNNGVIFLTVGILILGGTIGIFGRLLSRN